MKLTGDLETMSLADLLQWCASTLKTGTLRIRRDPLEKNFFFKEGNLYSSTSSSPRETLVQFLLRSGKVTEEHLSNAFVEQDRSNDPLGQVLIRHGIITESELAELLRVKTKESIYDCFLWTDADFAFLGGAVPDMIAVPTPFNIEALVVEGMRRADEWTRIRETFRSRFTTFKRERSSVGAKTDSTQDDQRILELVEQGKNLVDISLELNILEFYTACRLWDLFQRKLIRVDQSPEGASYEQQVEVLQAHVREGAACFNSGEYQKAVAAFEQALRIDPHHKYARLFVKKIKEIPEDRMLAARISLGSVPVVQVSEKRLTDMTLNAQEGFVLSRINGEWDVSSILKLCPLSEHEVLMILMRFVDDELIELSEPALRHDRRFRR